jgi:hypothetical protein
MLVRCDPENAPGQIPISMNDPYMACPPLGSVPRDCCALLAPSLNTLRDELKCEQLDVAAATGALKAAIERIVVNQEAASLTVHWRDSDTTTELPFWSRHYAGFDEPTDDERTATDAD